ncbi:hypothetical protein B0H14DRAFT_2621153 [Mycena olivaceomarginata]|nr:hypothetical protein B0H14DRAFT_2621153 [Mycena olivaceomarginata]
MRGGPTTLLPPAAKAVVVVRLVREQHEILTQSSMTPKHSVQKLVARLSAPNTPAGPPRPVSRAHPGSGPAAARSTTRSWGPRAAPQVGSTRTARQAAHSRPMRIAVPAPRINGGEPEHADHLVEEGKRVRMAVGVVLGCAEALDWAMIWRVGFLYGLAPHSLQGILGRVSQECSALSPTPHSVSLERSRPASAIDARINAG